ncbi:MAG: ABC transporter permease DevC [Pseudomonadota bacterium]
MKSRLSQLFNAFAPLGIPLAWRQLTRDRKRFVTAIAGVTFGFVLMLFQIGLYTASLRMVVFPHSALKGELVITSRNYGYFYSNETFPRQILYQLRGVPGVASVAPLNVHFVRWKNTTTGVNREIGALAVNPSENPFNHPELTKNIHLLTNSETVLFDRRSNQDDFGNVVDLFLKTGAAISEVERVRLKVKGLFSLGQTLASTGHIVISDEALARIFPYRPTNRISLGLATLDAGVDPVEMRRRLATFLPAEVRIMTAHEFQKEEQDYWITRTAIGFICLAGMLVGMFVGAIVVYQILYTDVTDHLREYATLKAIGITDMFLLRIVLTEALILLAASALPLTILSGLLFEVTRTEAGMPTELALPELLAVFAIGAAVCIFAGLLATRKLKTADPADIY